MYFPSPSKRFHQFHDIISKKKRSMKTDTELIEESYVSKKDEFEVIDDLDSRLTQGLKPCKTMVESVKVDSRLARGLKPCTTMVESVKVDSRLAKGLKPCTSMVESVKVDSRLAKGLKQPCTSMVDSTEIKKAKRLKAVDPGLDLALEPCKTTEIKKAKRLKADPELDLQSKPLKTTKIRKGKKLKGGFKRFLSNHGRTPHLVRFKKGCYGPVEDVDFDSLCGKYLLICSFSVPILSDDDVADKCRAIIETYDHLSSVGHPFELVVVVNMTSNAAAAYDQKSAFDHFYSAFSCLAIPFSEFETRDYISSCFTTTSFDKELNSAILVDPKGLILEDPLTLEHFFNYGSEWSPPFLQTALDEFYDQDHALRSRLDPMYALAHGVFNQDQRYLSLHGDILLCDPYLVLRRFDSETDVASTVIDLSCRYVGLYLCFDGRIMEQIKTAHDYCLANNQQLEIVLVCMSLFEEPNSYYNDLYQLLRLFNIKSWFLFDYDSKVCRRMWRIFGEGYLWSGEKFIIIPPNCESAELRGRDIIITKGITEYPFTRTAILKRRLDFVRSLTPVHLSLFKTGLFQNGKEYNSEKLGGKNLILYLDSLLSRPPRRLYDLLMKHYPEIKAMGWEIVFVPLDVASYTESYWNRQMVERVVVKYPFSAGGSNIWEMPWPVMSPSAAFEASVEEQLTCPEEDFFRSCLVAVGKDGNIVSRGVENKLETHGVTESLFDDVLESNLARELAFMSYLDDY